MSREDRSSLRMKFEHELRNNAKVTSSSSDTPEKIGIFSLTRGQNRPICGDNCNLVEILGRYDMIQPNKNTLIRLSITSPCSPLS